MSLTTDHAQLAGLITTSIRKKFIPFLRNKLRFADFAAPGQMAKHGGSKTLRWNLASKVAADHTTALAETTTTQNEIATITITPVLTTISEYGAFTKISSLAEMAWTRETRAEFGKILAEDGARTIDTRLRNIADDTTTFLVAGETATGTGTLSTSGDTATAQDIAVLSGRFNQNDAEGFDSQSGMYVVIVHGKVEQDLVTDVTTGRLSWVDINKHVEGIDGQKKIIVGSPGAVYGTMVLRSNNITTKVLTTTVTGYANIALADHGIGRSGFGAMDPQIIMKQSGPQDTSNPLNTFGTLGWKANLAEGLLDSDRVITYYSAI